MASGRRSSVSSTTSTLSTVSSADSDEIRRSVAGETAAGTWCRWAAIIPGEIFRHCQPGCDWASARVRHAHRILLIVLPSLPLLVAVLVSAVYLQRSVHDFQVIASPVSQRVHEASLIARLIGRLETEHAEMVYTHIGANRRCPNETQQLNCTIWKSRTSQSSATNCSNHTIGQNFTSVNTESLILATNDAISQLTAARNVWSKLSPQSRNFLLFTRPSYAADTINTSAYFTSDVYSTVIGELLLLLPVPPRDVTLPRLLLCVQCDTSLFTSVSGLRALASAQRATGSQCSLGYAFYTCGGHLAAVEQFYFRSNWSRSESKFRDVQYCYSDSTTAKLYSDTVECPQRILANMSASILQSRGCTTTDDVISWYSTCYETLSGTNSVMESLVVKSRTTLAAVYQHCMVEVVIYAFLILAEAALLCVVVYNSTNTVDNMRGFSAVFASQAEALKKERRKAEDLLSEMLPRSVAKRLRAGKTVDAEEYESATLFFSDIADFVDISSDCEPLELISFLNNIYVLIDSQIGAYDVYKVETIGSVYMVVSGMPQRNGERHVTEIANMAVDIRSAVNDAIMTRRRGDVHIQLRIGIHTGTCVAGVVGTKMTRYCLFGDTVNTASRMQSTGLPGKIHISESTYTRLSTTEQFQLDYRGEITVKGKGKMTTYWLVDRCPRSHPATDDDISVSSS